MKTESLITFTHAVLWTKYSEWGWSCYTRLKQYNNQRLHLDTVNK